MNDKSRTRHNAAALYFDKEVIFRFNTGRKELLQKESEMEQKRESGAQELVISEETREKFRTEVNPEIRGRLEENHRWRMESARIFPYWPKRGGCNAQNSRQRNAGLLQQF